MREGEEDKEKREGEMERGGTVKRERVDKKDDMREEGKEGREGERLKMKRERVGEIRRQGEKSRKEERGQRRRGDKENSKGQEYEGRGGLGRREGTWGRRRREKKGKI